QATIGFVAPVSKTGCREAGRVRLPGAPLTTRRRRASALLPPRRAGYNGPTRPTEPPMSPQEPTGGLAGDRPTPERYRLPPQHARAIVLFVRTDGRIAEANDAAVAAYGYSRAELLCRTIFELRDPATAAAVPAQMFQADSHGITFETSHR